MLAHAVLSGSLEARVRDQIVAEGANHRRAPGSHPTGRPQPGPSGGEVVRRDVVPVAAQGIAAGHLRVHDQWIR
jgi:hypothetical protein